MAPYLPQIVFFTFATILLFSAVMVVSSRHPVRAVLFLVLAFFSSSVLWMLLQAEFLALILIFVYIGAVMTLFLFVVMMLNLQVAPKQKNWVKYLPLSAVVVGFLIVLMWRIVHTGSFPGPVVPASQFSNTESLGLVLYTDYVYPFELVAFLLLASIIATITLTFRGARNRKSQSIQKQLAVNPKDQIELVNLPSEKR